MIYSYSLKNEAIFWWSCFNQALMEVLLDWRRYFGFAFITFFSSFDPDKENYVLIRKQTEWILREGQIVQKSCSDKPSWQIEYVGI